MQYLDFILIAIIILILSTIIKGRLGNNKTEQKNTNFEEYEKLQYLLSKTENSFYNVLKISIGEEYIICPKVRIADFIKAKKSKNWQANFNKINRKHIDFLICNKTMQPIFGIELDDKSHDNQYERDGFVNKLYETINFPILRIKANYNYSMQELKDKIELILNPKTNTITAADPGNPENIVLINKKIL